MEDKVEDCLRFTVDAADIYQTGYLLTREDGVAALSVACEVVAEVDDFANVDGLNSRTLTNETRGCSASQLVAKPCL